MNSNSKQVNHGKVFALKQLAAAAAMGVLGAGVWAPAHAASDLSRIQGLLAATPVGGWVKASTGTFASAWQTNPFVNGKAPDSIVSAWSSVAWDSNSGNLLLWGGGHANYGGNEMYVWNGASGAWTRGSLPSHMTQVNRTVVIDNAGNTGIDPRHYFVTDGAAPQSSHTYDNNVFLKKNNMFLTFGGAAYDSGYGFENRNSSNGNISRVGPWMWDPTKSDANKSGGVLGTFHDATAIGGNMWTNRMGSMTAGSSLGTGGFVDGATAYRIENNKDVVYVTMTAGCSGCSGFRSLYRYEVGDVRNGGKDDLRKVGESKQPAWTAANGTDFGSAAPTGQNTATIDSHHNLFVHTVTAPGFTADLGVWDLTQSDAANPSGNLNRPIHLIDSQGMDFAMTDKFAIEFDDASGKFMLWDGTQGGKLWMTEAEYDANGQLKSTWTILEVNAASGSGPSGNFVNGVLGKWKYVEELGAFVALNEYNAITGDAEVWFYKASAIAPVPEPGTYALLLAGLAAVGWRARRHNKA
jgi:hypothetical protein